MVGVVLLATPVIAAENGAPKSQKDKLSYTIGVNVGRNMKQLPAEIDPEQFTKGFKDGLSGAKTMLSDEEMHTVMTAFQKEMEAETGRKDESRRRKK